MLRYYSIRKFSFLSPNTSPPHLVCDDPQLALKHRQNKNQRQRIIVFVGSPLDEDEKTLVRLGKKLKKNNVAVDVINFGEEVENTAKLEAFIAAVNSSDNRYMLTYLKMFECASDTPLQHTIIVTWLPSRLDRIFLVTFSLLLLSLPGKMARPLGLLLVEGLSLELILIWTLNLHW